MALLTVAGLAILTPQSQAAEPSKQMEEFLNFDRKSQDGFIQNSIVMVATIAAQIEPKKVDCINEWYLKSDKLAEERNKEILSTMRQYKSYTPNSIMLAVVENACGKFKRP